MIRKIAFMLALALTGAFFGWIILANMYWQNMGEPLRVPETKEIVQRSTIDFLARRGIFIDFRRFPLLAYQQAGFQDSLEVVLFGIDASTDPIPEIERRLADDPCCQRNDRLEGYLQQSTERLLSKNGVDIRNPEEHPTSGVTCTPDLGISVALARIGVGSRSLLLVVSYDG